MTVWGILWRTENNLDGKTEYLIWERSVSITSPALFLTRKEARSYCSTHYSYIKNRPDLKAEPHGWKMPKVVKVECKYKVMT